VTVSPEQVYLFFQCHFAFVSVVYSNPASKTVLLSLSDAGIMQKKLTKRSYDEREHSSTIVEKEKLREAYGFK